MVPLRLSTVLALRRFGTAAATARPARGYWSEARAGYSSLTSLPSCGQAPRAETHASQRLGLQADAGRSHGECRVALWAGRAHLQRRVDQLVTRRNDARATFNRR
jgi:hypothetical protein